MNVEIREIGEGRGLVCNDLLRSLPRWFGIESAIQQYVSDVEKMPTFVAYKDDAAVGFVSLKKHNEWTAEVYVMAVRPEFHRKGIGRTLLAVSEEYLRSEQFHFLSVKTIAPSSSSAEYELTRKFYQAQGFKPVEEISTLWGEANPCLLMLKVLHRRMTTMRKAIPADAIRLSELRRESILKLAPAGMSVAQAELWASKGSIEAMERQLQTTEVWVAQLGDAIVGWVSFREDYLAGLYTDPQFTERGIGTQLLRLAERLMQQNDVRVIRTEASWNAEQFYIHRGYEPAGPRPSDGARPLTKRLQST